MLSWSAARNWFGIDVRLKLVGEIELRQFGAGTRTAAKLLQGASILQRAVAYTDILVWFER